VTGPQFYIKDIKERIKGKRVLDVGCCATYERNNLRRHRAYAKSASKIIGLDINRELLKKGMEEGGVELYYCDITDNLKVGHLVPVLGQFDHVIATDIIEHIGNCKSFLDNLHLFMTPNATLYLTAPNARSPYWWNVFLGRMNNGKVNEDHICWYEIVTLKETLSRSGFKVEEAFYCTQGQDKKAAQQLGVDWQDWMGFKLYVVVRKVNNE
jgi:2-polyprenyl-3-methyl-5-hydroxy-6-metoxy-1,4-benzoquinol methylase